MKSFQNLQKQCYMRVPFPVQPSEIQRAIEAFSVFLNLPDALKSHINLKVSPLHRRGEVGFHHRDPETHEDHDKKSFFHYHPCIFKKYPDFISNNPAIKQFLIQADTLWKAAYQAAHEVLMTFDKDFPGTVDRIFDTQEPHLILRFLKYEGVYCGRYLAKPHFDAGSFTLAIAESHPGLRIGTNPDDLELIAHKAEEALFMVSSNFRKIIDTDALKPAWHDVVHSEDAPVAEGTPFTRWALVAFLDGHNVETVSKAETHKWRVA